jgi:hypothetical protein
MLLNCDASIGLARNHSRLQAKKGAFWGQRAFRAKMRAKTASRKELGDPGASARGEPQQQCAILVIAEPLQERG